VQRRERSAKVVGEILYRAREKAGLTQQEVAARAGMDRSYISDVERGRASVSVDALLRICSALGVPAKRIIGQVETNLTTNRA
jgi:transcriptional regulator with XRE-family HTH domain